MDTGRIMKSDIRAGTARIGKKHALVTVNLSTRELRRANTSQSRVFLRRDDRPFPRGTRKEQEADSRD